MSIGHKGDFAYESTGSSLVDFFSKAGVFSHKNSFYGETVPILRLFESAWEENEYKAMQLAMWMRDCRGGSGNRSGFRDVIRWIAINHSQWMTANLHLVPAVGRWDDFIALIDTPCEQAMLLYWGIHIVNGNGLANKWAPREKNNREVYHKLRKQLRMSPPEFRKHLAKYTTVVETQMCNNEWAEINYNHVPSVAMSRSTKSFSRNDLSRFTAWKTSLADPLSGNKVNASVLFPHDCIHTLFSELKIGDGFYYWSSMRTNPNERYGESVLANAQFAALPNFMEKNNMRIMPICDFSGSMCDPISEKNTIRIIDVCMGLGLYCSDRVGENNPFYRKFIPFSNSSRLVDWKNDSFSIAVQKYNDRWCGSTNITSALDQILMAGVMLNATNEQMPNCLLIISDMQWDASLTDSDETSVETALKTWDKEGFARPKIVYWNLNKYEYAPSTIEHKDVALVSGYSPSLLTSICEGEDFTPVGIMERAIAKYEIVRP